MKTRLLILVMGILSIVSYAQAPQAFKYQTVVRDNAGEIIANQSVSFRISIRSGSAGGAIDYRETHSATTNNYGLANLEIGIGIPVIGNFEDIDWSTGTKFLEIELDVTGGSSYISIGTSQLLSVPYALYSENTENVDDADADPGNELNTSINLNGTDLKVTDAGGTITTDLGSLVEDADANPTNELQTLSQAGDQVTLSDGGGTISVSDADNDPANELQTVSKAGNTVTLSDGGGSFVDETMDADADPANELNSSVNLDGTDLKVTDAGGTITTDLGSLVEDSDADPANELNTSVSLDGTNLNVTDAGGTITTNLGSLVDDADADPTNELQTVSKAGNTVTLSNGGGSFVDETEDADADPANELNSSVNLDGTDLKVTDAGGTITTDLGSLVEDSDADPANELNTSVSLDGTNLNVTDAGGTITTNLGSLVDDADADPTNELQTVSKAGNTVTLSNGGGSFVDETEDADADPSNELQTLTLVGDDLSITNGNSVTLPGVLPPGVIGQTLRHDGILWAATSNLFHNGMNIGIGTINPSRKLDVDYGDILVQGPESFDFIGEQASLYLGTGHSYIRSEYGYGVTIGAYAASDAIAIKELSANVGIGTNEADKSKMGLFTDNKDGSKSLPISHRLTIGHTLDNKVLRLIGPLGNFGHGARLNFGDGDYVYIEEDEDDYLSIHANRVAIHGGLTNGTTNLDVSGRISINNMGGSIFIGDGAGYSDDLNDSRNIGIGTQALFSNTGSLEHWGFDNVAIGSWAMYNNYYGIYNIAIGNNALFNNTSGYNNVAIGNAALSSNTGGDKNIAIGSSALGNNVLGFQNIAIGDSTLHLSTYGVRNTAIGNMAGYKNDVGIENVFIGNWAGYDNEGSGNVFIGNSAGVYETGDNKLIINNVHWDYPLIFGDFIANEIVINGDSTHNINDRTFFVVGYAGGTTHWYMDSDKQLKKNITTISSSLDKVLKLRGVNYEWKEIENREEGQQMGFVAQEVQKVIPEVVDEKDGHYAMQYAPITALLVEAMKEQQQMIEELQKELEKLKERE